MNAAEVVVHMKQRQHSDVIFELLTEGIRQPGEPAHVHPHVEILSLDVGRADVLRVGRTDDRLSLGAKTLRRAVTGRPLGIAAVDLNQLRVVDILSESIGDGSQVHLVSVRGQLDSIRQPVCNVPKELRRTPGVPPSCQPRQDKLALSFNGRERPNVATDPGFHLGLCDVLLLAPDKRPDLIDLDPLGRNVTDHAVMVFGASRANGHQEPKDSALRHAGKANRRANRTAFDQGRKNRNLLFKADYVCHGSSIRQRFRIVNRQTKKDRKLCGFLGVCPARLRCLPGATAALFIGHGFEAALPADPAPFGPHLAHDLLDDGKLYGFRQGNGFQGNAAGVLDGIEYFCFASPLWHTSSVTRNAAARQEAKNSNRPTTEVRAVTIVQKEIEAKVSGAVWDRQTQWNQKRDIYAGLLAAFSELELAFEKMTMIDLVTPRRPRPGVHGSRTRRFYINQRSTEGARLGTSVFVPKGCFRRGSLHKDRRFGLGQTAAPFSGSKEPSDRS